MRLRLIATAMWFALLTAAILLIEQEERHSAAPLLINAADRFCDVRPPDTRPRGRLEPMRPFTTDERSVV